MVHRQALTRLHGRVQYRVGSVRQVPHVPVPAEPAGKEQDDDLCLPKEELATGETGLVVLYVILYKTTSLVYLFEMKCLYLLFLRV